MNLTLRIRLLQSVSVLCFVLLLLIGCAYGIGLVLTNLAAPLRPSYVLIWIALGISVSLYFKRPWIVVVVSWIELVRSLTETKISKLTSIDGILFYPGYQIILLLAAHGGFISLTVLKRLRRKPVATAMSREGAGCPR